ncbi:MAG: hypothetical protein QOH65_2918 [Methylobacteriaceae bacterium]|jgi:hypothetical protein|nr:hypothetical protein [Methylobacteriaceae bacterium]
MLRGDRYGIGLSDCPVDWTKPLSLALLRTVASIVGLTVAAAVLLILGKFAGPDIEARAFPIISASLVAGSVHRADGTGLCWTLHMEKFRNDVPAYFNYRVIFTRQMADPQSGKMVILKDRVPVAAYRVNVKGERVFLSTYGFANHSANQIWDTKHCAELPQELGLKNGAFKVEGEAFYDTPHHLWLVPQPLPSFEVPAG